jgi:hypothetical protein
MKKLIVTLAASVLAVSAVHADWWQDGNLVALRAGDGIVPLANTGNQIFLDQFTPAGSLYTSLAIPKIGTTAMLQSGTASSEGFLSSYNKTLVFIGYNTTGTGGSLPSTTSSSVSRAVGQVDINGNYTIPVQTTLAANQAFTGGSPRSAVTDGSGRYWGSGAASSTTYSGTYFFGAGTAGFVTNRMSPRTLNIYDNKLMYTVASATYGFGVYQWSGEPTAGDNTSSVLINTGAGSSPYDFVINSSLGIAYVADDRTGGTAGTGGIFKYTWNGSAWVQASQTFTIAANEGARSLAVDWLNPSGPKIYATTSETSTSANNWLGYFIDDGQATEAWTQLAQAPVNEQWRGIEMIPEPATTALLGLGLLAFWSRLRRIR